MIKKQCDCVDCDLPCIKEACPYYKSEIVVCDECGNYAEYSFFDEKDLCESCAHQYLSESWDESSIEEKAEMLGMSCKAL